MDLLCPKCHSKAYKRNGFTRHGKQNYRCLDCKRQFSVEPIEVQKNDEEIVFVAALDKYTTI